MDKLTIEELSNIKWVAGHLDGEDIIFESKDGERKEIRIDVVLKQFLDTMRENEYMRIRLAQIASGDYKACGHRAEDVAADALHQHKQPVGFDYEATVLETGEKVKMRYEHQPKTPVK